MGCSICGRCDETALYALVDGRSYCNRCWISAGRPWPRLKSTPEQIAQAEITARRQIRKVLTGNRARPTF